MLGGVKLADYADNKSFFGTRGADSDYANIFKMAAGHVPRAAPHQTHLRPGGERRPPLHRSVERQILERVLRAAHRIQGAGQGRRPHRHPAPLHLLRTQFGQDGPRFARRGGRDRRASCGPTKTPSWTSRATPIPPARARPIWSFPSERADDREEYLDGEISFPAARMRTAGNGPDRPSPTTTRPRAARRTAAPISRFIQIRQASAGHGSKAY